MVDIKDNCKLDVGVNRLKDGNRMSSQNKENQHKII